MNQNQFVQKMNQAIALQKANEHDAAIKIYESILKQLPNHPDVLHLSGVSYLKTNRLDKAQTLITNAIKLNSSQPLYYFNLGHVKLAKNELSDAAKNFLHAFQLNPSDLNSILAAAQAFFRDQNYSEAINAYEKLAAFSTDPQLVLHPLALCYYHMKNNNSVENMGDKYSQLYNIPEYLTLLGVIRSESGSYEESYNYFKKAHDIQQSKASLRNLANSAYAAKKYENTIHLCSELLNKEPHDAQLHYMTGMCHEQIFAYQDAVKSYNSCLSIHPDFEDCMIRLAKTHLKAGSTPEFLPIFEDYLSKRPPATELQSTYAEILAQCKGKPAATEYLLDLQKQQPSARLYSLLASLYSDNPDQALMYLKQAVELGANDAYFSIGNILFSNGDAEQAVIAFQRYLSCFPDNMNAKAALLHCYRYLADYPAIQSLEYEVEQYDTHCDHPCQLPFNHSVTSNQPSLTLKIAKACAGTIPCRDSQYKRKAAKLNNNQLKIGWLSPDFRDHAQGNLLKKILPHLKHLDIISYGYSLSKGDESDANKIIRDSCHIYREFEEESSVKIIETIRADEIDILIDLKGWTFGARPEIAASRVAPVQMRWLGQPGTSGAAWFDALICDNISIPSGDQQYYTESLLHLPHSYLCTDPPEKRVIPPAHPFIFGSLCQSYKLDLETMDCFARILRKTHDSQLWLMSSETTFQANVLNYFNEKKINTSRIRFFDRVGREEHLSRIQNIHLALDTFRCNGMSSTADILSQGIPVLCLKGNTFASRASSSIISNAGLDKLVCSSEDEYVNTAVHLSKNISELQAHTKTLLSANAPLFQADLFAKNFADTLRQFYLQFTN